VSETQKTITHWAHKTFGPTTPWNAFARMQKEYWELRDIVFALDQVPLDPSCLDKVQKAREECADVLVTLYRVAEVLGCDLHEEVNRKMKINRARKWVVDENGHGQHV
jgi:NTP pyrophosphatase (non-canonical NTP hydrolase)